MPKKKSFDFLRKLAIIFPYIWKFKWLYTIGLVCLLLQNYGYVKIPLYMRLTLQEISGNNDGKRITELILYTFFFLGLTAFFMYLMRSLIIGASRKVEYWFRRDIYHKIMNLPVDFYKKQQTGDLISRVTNDVNDVRTMAGPGMMYIPNSLSRLAFFLPEMAALDKQLTLFIFLQMLFIVILILLIMPKLRPLYKKIQVQRSTMNNRAWQILSGMTTVKLSVMEKTEYQRFQDISRSYLKSNLRLAIFEGFTWPFFLFVFGLSQIVILVWGGLAIIDGRLSIEELLQFTIMLGIITFPIFALGWVMSIMQQGLSALERISLLLHTRNSSVGRSLQLPKSKKIPILEIKNLGFTNSEGHEIIKSFSLKLKPGEIVGIAGRTGSGKTLLLESIMGLVKPTAGSITLGGKDISALTLSDIYTQMAFVPQETFLFSASMKHNIGFEEEQDPSFPRIVNSAKLSDIHKEIIAFPHQYQQEIGERGISLSGGQKQRTAISRSLYKNKANILILDDSLSSIDSQTEENIISNLKSLRKKKSILFVSHKISLLKTADRICYVEDGRILEQGSHFQLLKLHGAYARLAKLQKLETSIH